MSAIYFTPGPTELHAVAKEALAAGIADGTYSISHRSERFREIYKEAVASVREIMAVPAASHVVFLSSATEAMERVVENCAGGHSFHFVNGSFSKRFCEMSQMAGRTTEKYEVKAGEGFDLSQFDSASPAELVCVTQNETSTGVWIPPQYLTDLKGRIGDRILAVDAVSSAPHPCLDLQAIDVCFFSVQKCFGLPSGLGVVIVHPRALAAAEELQRQGRLTDSYHSLLRMVALGEKQQTYETPNVLDIYLLSKVASHFRTYGIDRVRTELQARATYLYSEIAQLPGASIFVKEAQYRSPTVVTVELGARTAEIKKALAARGLQVGAGYGEFKDTQIRIANFPCHSREGMEALVGALRELLG